MSPGAAREKKETGRDTRVERKGNLNRSSIAAERDRDLYVRQEVLTGN